MNGKHKQDSALISKQLKLLSESIIQQQSDKKKEVNHTLFVWLFFYTYALLAVVYVSHVEDRFINTPRS
jgi:hypothetical protein